MKLTPYFIQTHLKPFLQKHQIQATYGVEDHKGYLYFLSPFAYPENSYPKRHSSHRIRTSIVQEKPIHEQTLAEALALSKTVFLDLTSEELSQVLTELKMFSQHEILELLTHSSDLPSPMT